MKLFNCMAVLSLSVTASSLMAQNGGVISPPGPVPLASSSSFAALAGTTVTFTGGGTVTGNIGTYPNSANNAFVPGTPPVTVVGTVYVGGPVAAQAEADLLTAYNYAAAAARGVPTTLSGNIGTLTLGPGLYNSTSSLMISGGGNVVLDAGGNANAVWIFQIGSTLTTSSGFGITLAGNANPANIFWQVGTSATIGSGSAFYGTILADTSITLVTGATLSGRALAINGAVTIDTGGLSSVTIPAPAAPALPTVTSTIPGDLVTSVPIGNALTATFSEAMNPATINSTTFTLQDGGTPVPGTVSYVGVTATFAPSSNLAPSNLYTATITTGAADPSGNALAANYVWTFTTGGGVNVTMPTVISTVPSSGATNVPIGNALIATFNEAMNPTTITSTTFTLQNGITAVAGAVTYVGVTATFTPSGTLAPNALFTATITTGAKDLGGNALAANYVWTFTTGATRDTTPPQVISTVPANGAAPVGPALNVVANFSEVMNPLTINTATFTLKQGTTPVTGTVSYAGTSATFRPVSNLAPNTLYTAEITTGAADLSGNLLPANYIWSFTTGAAAAAGPTPVCLSNFAVLAGSAVVNSGSTIVTGDIGVSPGASMSGFPPGILNGTIHAGDAVAAQGVADFAAAYADAVARSVSVVPVSGDIGGQTFTTGLYRSISSLQISSGNLTLDAKGNVNAVFIIQIGSTLTTGAGVQVFLIGGAQASNVFWQVGTSATLGAGSTFNGSILADQSITVNLGANVYGRLEALTGTITLDQDTVTSPPPAVAAGGIFNAASWAGPVAAGSIAAVFGNNLGSSLASATAFPLPTTLGETSLLIGTQGAPLYMTSCSQVNLQIPWELAGQTQAPVAATVGGLVSASQPATIAPFAPGVFSLNMLGSGQGAVEIAPTAELAAPLGPGARPVNPGEYIAIFCTGLGAVSNQPATGAAASSSPLSATATLPTVTIGGVGAQVTYSGLAPGFAGLYQVNAVVPDGTPSGSNVNLVISIGGVTSNTVTIAVQ
jgi:uncharacterized protein (TIGR03437 family)